MKSVRMLTPPPIGVGSRGDATVRIFGLGVTDPVEITEFAPPTRFAIRHDGTFTGGGVITLEPGADGTTTIVRWDETLDRAGAAAPVGCRRGTRHGRHLPGGPAALP